MTHEALENDGFRHEAFFYAGPDEFLAGTGSFVRDGLDADEAVLVLLSAPKIEALRSELSSHSDRVRFADMGEVGSNPARIHSAWREFVSEHPGRRLRGIGEPIGAERSAAELIECQRHESLLNLAFADTPDLRLLCLYDTSTLAPEVLQEARRSHPYLMEDGIERESSGYRGLEASAAPFADPLPDPQVQPGWRVFQALTLPAMRKFICRQAASAGFGRPATDDLVLAVNEVATNSVVHGGGGGILRMWQEADSLICEVSDKGLILEPLIGRERPLVEDPVAGHGLWLANQVCDLVQIRSFASGSVVRVHKRRD